MTSSKWDKRYESATQAGQASEVLQRYQHLLPESGHSLDLACGLGANALLLAQHGLTTEGWDASGTALRKLAEFAAERGLNVKTRQRNVEECPPQAEAFDVIVVSNFLHRATFPQLLAALRPGGLLYYQTFIKDKSPDIGPTSPEFLLDMNELLRLATGLRILAYHEEGTIGDMQQGFRQQAMLVGRREPLP
jgi:2-polyprenyl-3-methyl-5-hydroxy-6-metoxy-1,4-benzoquinol methylase